MLSKAVDKLQPSINRKQENTDALLNSFDSLIHLIISNLEKSENKLNFFYIFNDESRLKKQKKKKTV